MKPETIHHNSCLFKNPALGQDAIRTSICTLQASLAESWMWGCWQDCTSVVVIVHCFFSQNTLTADDHSPEDSFSLNPEDRREYPDLQAAHRPFPKQRFRQENGHTSLQRDGPRSFLLDLPNFPDLSKADINGQNPNIQVQIYANL